MCKTKIFVMVVFPKVEDIPPPHRHHHQSIILPFGICFDHVQQPTPKYSL